MKNIWLWLAVIIVLVGGYFVFFNKSQTANSEPIKIGALSHMTGFGNTWGIGENKAILLRAKELQKEGINLQIVSEDCASDIPKCVSAAQKLINVDKVVAIVGPQWTEWFEPIAPLANQYKVALISPSGLSDQSQQPYAFSLGISYSSWARAILGFAKAHNAFKASVITTENAFFNKVTAAIKSFAPEYGVTLIDDVRIASSDEKDFSTVIAKMKQKSPQIIFVDLLQPQALSFIKKAKEQGVTALIIYPSGIKTDTPILAGTYMVDFTMAEALNAKFRAEYGSDKDIAESSQTAYDALSIIGDAVKSGAKTSDDIKSFIREIKDYKGITGTINFDTNGFAVWSDEVLKPIKIN